jgi:hypothetical protein
MSLSPKPLTAECPSFFLAVVGGWLVLQVVGSLICWSGFPKETIILVGIEFQKLFHSRKANQVQRRGALILVDRGFT